MKLEDLKVFMNKACLYCMREKEDGADECPYCHKKASAINVLPHHLPPFTFLAGRYMLGVVLGEGGFGITYVGLDTWTDERVAIKELFLNGKQKRNNTRTVLLDESEDGRRYYQECKMKFLQEASVLQRLEDKAGIVSILDQFEENNTAYIVMEFLEGVDLREYLLSKENHRIPHEEAFRMLRPVMKSVIQVHSSGIIHRDISPDNIRYVSGNRLKIFDFGSAKVIEKRNASELVLVKEGYAPPEQYASAYKVGPWMDVYAMAATFYRCITGRKPRMSLNRTGALEWESPSKFGVKIPSSLEKVLRKGMALQVEDRYQDMWEFYQDLKKIYVKDKEKDKTPPKPVTPPGPPKPAAVQPVIPPVPESDNSGKVAAIVVIWIIIMLIVIAVIWSNPQIMDAITRIFIGGR